MDIRIIIAIKNGGEQETVFFTEDFETPVSDFVSPGYTVNFDEVRDLDLPDCFPLEYTLKRD